MLGCKLILYFNRNVDQVANTSNSLHCHIAWHISEGLGMQFVESPDQITFPPQSEYEETCTNWNNYAKTAFYQKHDSGL